MPNSRASAVGPPAASIARFVASFMGGDDKQRLADCNRQMLGAAHAAMRHGLPMDDWSRRLARLRQKTGLSQAKVARELGIAAPSVAQWETGRSRPDISRLNALAKLYGVDIQTLCGNDIPLPQPDPDRARLVALVARLAPSQIKTMALIAEGLLAQNDDEGPPEKPPGVKPAA